MGTAVFSRTIFRLLTVEMAVEERIRMRIEGKIVMALDLLH